MCVFICGVCVSVCLCVCTFNHVPVIEVLGGGGSKIKNLRSENDHYDYYSVREINMSGLIRFMSSHTSFHSSLHIDRQHECLSCTTQHPLL